MTPEAGMNPSLACPALAGGTVLDDDSQEEPGRRGAAKAEETARRGQEEEDAHRAAEMRRHATSWGRRCLWAGCRSCPV